MEINVGRSTKLEKEGIWKTLNMDKAKIVRITKKDLNRNGFEAFELWSPEETVL